MKPIRVALSGSGFKFPAHVGALLAVRDAGFEPIGYAGTSGGSIVAALAATGMDLETMKELTLGRDWSDMLSWSPLSLLTKMGYCSGSELEEFLLENTKGLKFSDLSKTLTIVATDMAGDGEFIFSQEATPDITVALACRASAAIPFVYTPIQLGAHFLCDGGVANNLPVDLLPVDQIPAIGIHLVSNLPPLKPGIYGPTTFIPRLLEILMDSCEEAHAAVAAKVGAAMSIVDTTYASGLDRNISLSIRQRLLQDGYNQTAKALVGLE